MATVTVPPSPLSPDEDANKLRKAFQGWGTDDKTVIDILSHRSAGQRLAIAKAYAYLYGESLLERLQSELSGDFGKAVMLWTMDPAERDAKLANEALKRKGDRDLWVIIEVACASSPDHLVAVRKTYFSLYSSSIEEEVAQSFSTVQPLSEDIEVIDKSQFTTLLKTAILCLASPENHFAEIVRTSVVGLGTDEDSLTRAIVTRAEIDLKKIKEEYKIRYKTTLRADVIGDTSGDYKRFLLALVGSEDP